LIVHLFVDTGTKVEGILRQSADVEEVERRVQEYEQGIDLPHVDPLYWVETLKCYIYLGA